MFDNNREKVDKMTSLRLQYLMLILKEGLTSVTSVSDKERGLICEMAALRVEDPYFVCLCTCDLLMSSTDWSLTWSRHLSASESVSMLCDHMMDSFGLDKSVLLAKTVAGPQSDQPQDVQQKSGKDGKDGKDKTDESDTLLFGTSVFGNGIGISH